MTYPLPVNTTSIGGLFQYADQVTQYNGFGFGSGIVLALYVIIFCALKLRGEETSDCFIAAGFATVIVTIIARLLQIVNDWTLWVSLFLLAASWLWTYWNKDY